MTTDRGSHGRRVGGTAKPGLARPSFSGALPGAGSMTNFAIIEPVTTRREVQANIGSALSRGQIQTLVGEIQRAIR